MRTERQRHSTRIAAAAVLVALLVTLVSSTATLVKPPCPVKSYDPNQDYFLNKTMPLSSSYWTIQYYKNYKVLKNTAANQTYVLYMCNTPVPNVTLYPGAGLFEIPSFLIGTSSRTIPRYLERLGLREQIHHVPDLDLITSPCLLELANEGFTTGLPAGWTTAGVDVVFGRDPNAPKETSAVLPTGSVMVSAVVEDNLLAKFEWIKFISAWFNLESLASQMFSDVVNTYTCNWVTLDEVTTNFTAIRRPVVAWVGPVGDGTFVTSNYTYKSKVITDSGGKPIVFPNPVNLSTVQAQLLQADVLIDESTSLKSLSEIAFSYGLDASQANATFWEYGKTYPFLYNRRVYQVDKVLSIKGQTDDFDQSFWAMPDYVQEDLMNILFPYINPAWILIWLRNVTAAGKDVVYVSSTQCPEGNASSPFASTYYGSRPACHTPTLSALQANNAAMVRGQSDVSVSSAAPSSSSGGGGGFNFTALIAALATIVALGVITGAAFRFVRQQNRDRSYLEKRGINLGPIAISEGPGGAAFTVEAHPVAPVSGGAWTKMEDEADVTDQRSGGV
ncbi:hypothetical protein M427DRAFT_69753 [Gonapodya prolifera JEL478]|uniref:Periplasmic binding protein-like II n=1 Tax=Gonapodya prolifera (strain JEL478) TaxID=1344416 RepID=A0A139AGG9_GONPJ|nr:hypothetical protein M427DRAFT_69753 [Gonapodya prolifera JEL478]|eukprot:KXS15850.1 hypothetical protein M427DRAFT_69753 [Gonapodya prolifera JEL478]